MTKRDDDPSLSLSMLAVEWAKRSAMASAGMGSEDDTEEDEA